MRYTSQHRTLPPGVGFQSCEALTSGGSGISQSHDHSCPCGEQEPEVQSIQVHLLPRVPSPSTRNQKSRVNIAKSLHHELKARARVLPAFCLKNLLFWNPMHSGWQRTPCFPTNEGQCEPRLPVLHLWQSKGQSPSTGPPWWDCLVVRVTQASSFTVDSCLY